MGQKTIPKGFFPGNNCYELALFYTKGSHTPLGPYLFAMGNENNYALDATLHMRTAWTYYRSH